MVLNFLWQQVFFFYLFSNHLRICIYWWLGCISAFSRPIYTWHISACVLGARLLAFHEAPKLQKGHEDWVFNNRNTVGTSSSFLFGKASSKSSQLFRQPIFHAERLIVDL